MFSSRNSSQMTQASNSSEQNTLRRVQIIFISVGLWYQSSLEKRNNIGDSKSCFRMEK